jgi:hypothetical protein
MNTQQAKNLFDSYYKATYQRWRINEEKAGKDIVGEEYENMRKKIYSAHGFRANKEKVAGFNADIVVKDKNNKIVLIEEDKGHYVDSCFLKRFLVNAAEIIDSYINAGVSVNDIPLIVLSSPTTLNSYEKHYMKTKKLFRKELRDIMDTKIKYWSYCDHDRVKKDKYFTDGNSCFKLSDALISEQLTIIQSL